MNPARAEDWQLGHVERVAGASDLRPLLDPGRGHTGDGRLQHRAERLMNLQHQMRADAPAAVGYRAGISADGAALAG